MPALRTSASTSSSNICHICGKRLTRAHDLRRHIRDTHDRSSRYGCTVCPRQMAQKSNMVRHMASQHFAFEEPLVIRRSQSTASSSPSSSVIDLNSNVMTPRATEPVQSLESLLLDTITPSPVVFPPAATHVTEDFASYAALPAINYEWAAPNSLAVDPLEDFMSYLTGATDSLPHLFNTPGGFYDAMSSSSGQRTPDSLADFSPFSF